jgi:hypothetical protein
MPSKANDHSHAFALSSGLGHEALVFGEDEIFQLLKAAVKHEGSQLAFAKRHGVNRTYLNMVLSGKRPASTPIAEALGLHKVYAAK